MIKLVTKRSFFVAFIVTLCISYVFPAHEKGSSRMEMINYNSSSNNAIYLEDNKYTVINSNLTNVSNIGFFDFSYKNRLVLGIDRTLTDLGAVASLLSSTKAYRAEVDVKLMYNKLVPSANNYAFTGVTVVKTLTVNYSGFNAQPATGLTERDIDAIVFESGYQAKVVITGVRIYKDGNVFPNYISSTNYPKNLYIELQSDAERYYNLNTSSAPYSNIGSSIGVQLFSSATDGNEIEVKWERIAGAEEYELEWLWLDEYTYNTSVGPNPYWNLYPEINFKTNSTRIRTDQNFYRISNVYESGYIFVRIRGVGISKAPTALTILGASKLSECYTPWTWADLTNSPTINNPVNFAIGSTVPNYINISAANSHEEKKNWVYTSTFAEEGKKNEVVSYFDGAQYNRQSVTKNNSENKAVVAETYYDYLGRASVNALPTPIDDARIKFFQTTVQTTVGSETGFNFNNASPSIKAFTKEIFANSGTAGQCGSASAAQFNAQYGTGKYYSANNPFINNSYNNGYIPTSVKDSLNSKRSYAFSQTLYTKDNTGKVDRQSGVGEAFKIEATSSSYKHDTKYLYGSVTQEELDRLFGSEAGYAKNYTKNVTIDPNGQISISYLNQEGKVVATALGGSKPANMEYLNSATGVALASNSSNNLTVDLLNKNNSNDPDKPTDNNELKTDELSFNSKIIVTSQGDYKFNYTALGTCYEGCQVPDDDQNPTLGFTSLCYDCVYDLVFDITDACGNRPGTFTPITYTLGKVINTVQQALSLDNNSLDDAVNFSFQNVIPSSDPDYPLLKVTLPVGEWTIKKSLKVNQTALNSYLNDYLANCPKPKQQFNDEEAANADITGCDLDCRGCVDALGPETTFVATYMSENSVTNAVATKAYKDLVAACLEPCKYTSNCETAKEAMILDVAPRGQYAEYNDSYDANSYPLSIYNVNCVLPRRSTTTSEPWRNPTYYKSTPPSGSSISHYFEEDGSVAYVKVKKTGTNTYIPALVSSAPVTAIANTIDMFNVEPQYLANLADFINSYRNDWGRSLIYYHPEYGYLKWCIQNEDVVLQSATNSYIKINNYGPPPTYNFINTSNVYVKTSYAYDSLMFAVEDLNDVDQSSANNGLNFVLKPLENDPYWKTFAVYHIAGNSGNPSSITMPKPANSANITGYTNLETNSNVGSNVAQLQSPTSALPEDFSSTSSFPSFYFKDRKLKTANNRYFNFKGSGLSLLQYAAIISTPLGNNITQSTSQLLSSLLNTSSGYYPTNAPTSADDIRYITSLINPADPTGPNSDLLKRKAWENFKTLYLALKDEMQQEAAQSFVMNGAERGCNNCIGKSDFDVQTVRFTTYSNFAMYQWLTGPTSFPFNWFSIANFFNNILTLQQMDWYQPYSTTGFTNNKNQICNLNTKSLYQNKIKRFSSNEELTSSSISASPQNAQAAIYAQTGLCPVAYDTQSFLNALAQDNTNLFTTTPLNLSNFSEFTSNLYTAMLPVIPVPYVQPQYKFLNINPVDNKELLGELKIPTSPAITSNVSLKFTALANLPSYYPSAVVNWNNYPATYIITQIDSLVPSTTTSGQFSVRAMVKNLSNSTMYNVPMICSFSGFNFTGCSFVPPCKANGNAKAISALLNTFSSNGVFPSPYNNNTSSFQAGDLLSSTSPNTPYSYVFMNSLKPLLEVAFNTNTDWEFKYYPNASPPYLHIYDNNHLAANKQIKIEFTTPFVYVPDANSTSATAPNISCVQTLQNFQPDPAVSGGFTADGIVNFVNSNASCPSGTLKIKGVVSFGLSTPGLQPWSMGNCSFNLATCNTPQHEVKNDLSNWVVTSSAGFASMITSNSMDISTNTYLTPALRTFLPSQQTSSSSGPAQNYYWWLKDQTASNTNSLIKGWFVVTQSPIAPSTPPPANASCAVEIKNLSTTSPLLFANLTNMGTAFDMVNSSLSSGNYYSAKVNAVYSTGNNLLQITTSCFPMKSCDTPPCSNSNANNNGSAVIQIDPFDGTGTGFSMYNQNGNCTVNNVNGGTTTAPSLNDAYLCNSNSTIVYPNQPLSTGCSPGCLWVYSNQMFMGNNCLFFINMGSCPTSNCCTYDKNRFTAITKNFNVIKTGYYTFNASINYFISNQNSCIDSYVNNTDYTEFYIDNQLFYTHSNNSSQYVTHTIPVPFGLTAGTHSFKIIFKMNNFEEHRSFNSLLGLTKTGDVATSLPCNTTASSWPTDTMPTADYIDPCAPYLEDLTANTADEKYNAFIDSSKTVFIKNYVKRCLGSVVENLTMNYTNNDYHYTLYYYDQAGNLARTVPPQGVAPINLTATYSGPTTFGAAIKADRANYGTSSKQVYTNHRYITTYKYNSLNQLISQTTPDAGTSKFYYDNLGRLVASQNAEQKFQSPSSSNNIYSYTKYDELGRISMVGQLATYDMEVTSGNTNIPPGGTIKDALSNTNYPFNLTIVSNSHKEVTRTFYGDAPGFTPIVPASNFANGYQDNLRSRVASVMIQSNYSTNTAIYDHATHYSYDVHGNVKELIQDNPDMGRFTGQRFKKIQYTYDLISGKVNTVVYQKDKPDMFAHSYLYDANNRITNVYTSRDGVLWDQDAKYFYYPHGPLARTEVGEHKPQSLDYAYTLQGWIRGVNSEGLKQDNDMGKDGYSTLTGASNSYNLNRFNGRDGFGYGLNYYKYNSGTNIEDYRPINGSNATTSTYFLATDGASINDLYNGNIKQMSISYLSPDPTNITVPDISSTTISKYQPYCLKRAFKYDQLNRLVQAKAFGRNVNGSNAWVNATTPIGNAETFSYDQNGNISIVGRKNTTALMDTLTYYYYDVNGGTFAGNTIPSASPTNKLAYVTDGVGAPTMGDIGNQTSATNYTYDKNGNMITDAASGITSIGWSVYGKIKSINKSSSYGYNSEFRYDAMGNRIYKRAYDAWTIGGADYKTYYVRDAQGNVMATYYVNVVTVVGIPTNVYETLSLLEQDVYGSTRMGVRSSADVLGYIVNNVNTANSLIVTGMDNTRNLGKKNYEITNHLGNIVTTISDRKLPVDVATVDGIIDYFVPDILTASDYYAFGATMPGRNYNSTDYRYGFNNKEKDDEIKGSGNSYDFGDRMYDPRLGRWSSVDWKSHKYPHVSPYIFALDNPTHYIDVDGNDIGVGVTKVSSSNGQITVDAVITVRMKVVNLSNRAMSSTEMKTYANEIKTSAEGAFSGSGYFEGNLPKKDGKYNNSSINYNITVNVEIEAVESLDKLGKDDHVLVIVDQIPPLINEKGQKVDPIGLTANGDQNARIMAVEAGTFDDKTSRNTAVHELGHALGLGHAKSVNNLMNESVTNTYGISGEQRGDMGISQGLNNNSKVGYKGQTFKTTAKQDVNSFLKQNSIKTTAKPESKPIKG